jgi:uncharacterized protein
MNIWLDPTLFSQSFVNTFASPPSCPDEDSCPKDGPIVPTNGNTLVFSIPSEKDVQHLHIHTFVCVDILHNQRCGEAYWLVCNPTGAGTVAVIDASLYTLLNCFRSPKTLQDVMNGPFENPIQVAQAVAIFTRLGFLHDLDQPLSVFDQEEPQSLAAWLHITNACNLHCDYCHVNKNSEHMTDNTSKRAVDALIRSAVSYCYQGMHLAYAGGEASLRFPQVIATHDYALQQCQKFGLSLSASMLSNGAALPVRYIDQLKERQISLMISLDGVGEQHDQQRSFVNGQSSFPFVDRTITRLLKHGLTPYINVTVTRRNLAGLPSLLAYIFQHNLPFGLNYYRENEYSAHLPDLQFSNEQMITGMRAAFAYIEEHLPPRSLLSGLVDKARTWAPHRYTCGVGRNYLAIDQHGGIAKCQVDINTTVTTIDAENPLRVIRENRQGVTAVPVEEKAGCRDCEWRYWCSGGCPILTYRVMGRSDVKSPNCSIYKALFPEALRLEALRLLKYTEPIVL